MLFDWRLSLSSACFVGVTWMVRGFSFRLSSDGSCLEVFTEREAFWRLIDSISSLKYAHKCTITCTHFEVKYKLLRNGYSLINMQSEDNPVNQQIECSTYAVKFPTVKYLYTLMNSLLEYYSNIFWMLLLIPKLLIYRQFTVNTCTCTHVHNHNLCHTIEILLLTLC